MLHPDIRIGWKNDQVGYGLYASALIPVGTMVYVQDALDTLIPPDSPLLGDERYASHIDKYCVIDPLGNRIVCWDAAKYVNHCCHYNSLATAYGFEIAIREISSGEEVTDDYVAFNLEEDMPLSCHFDDCRKVLHPDDFELLAPTWDAQIKVALQSFQSASQPLLSYLPDHHLLALKDYLRTGQGYRPVDRLRYKPASGKPE
jgi:uncharacterized protein